MFAFDAHIAENTHETCIQKAFGMNAADIDTTDRKILALLQHDARLTNNELAERVHLSASQCSRRRARLESEGVISGYHASVNREKAGFELVNFITVTLATHDRSNAARFAELMARLPEVQEAHALTGEMDYIVKVVTRDLRGLSDFVNDMLLPHEAVQNVKTAIVLQTLKDSRELPL